MQILSLQTINAGLFFQKASESQSLSGFSAPGFQALITACGFVTHVRPSPDHPQQEFQALITACGFVTVAVHEHKNRVKFQALITACGFVTYWAICPYNCVLVSGLDYRLRFCDFDFGNEFFSISEFQALITACGFVTFSRFLSIRSSKSFRPWLPLAVLWRKSLNQYIIADGFRPWLPLAVLWHKIVKFQMIEIIGFRPWLPLAVLWHSCISNCKDVFLFQALITACGFVTLYPNCQLLLLCKFQALITACGFVT